MGLFSMVKTDGKSENGTVWLSVLVLFEPSFPFEAEVWQRFVRAFKARPHRVLSSNGIDKEHTEIIAFSIPLFARPRKKICGWGRGLARQWSPDWLAPTKQSFWSHAQMVVNFVLLYQSSLQIGSAKLLDLLIHSNVRRNFSLPFCYCSSLGEYRSVRCR